MLKMRINICKGDDNKIMKNEKGITLVALVITIIVLIIIAGIAVNMSLGDNGIFTKVKEAKQLQITAEAKEKIGTEILAAQMEAIERNEQVEQSQIEDIISKYGQLQDDKDTIILKDTGYKISLLDIYNGTIADNGSYTEAKAKIENKVAQLEEKNKELEKQLNDTGNGPLIDLICVSTYVGSGGDGGSKYTYVIDEKCKYYTVTNYTTPVDCAKKWSWNSNTTTHTIAFYGSDGNTLISTVTPNIGEKTEVPANAKYAVIDMGSWGGSAGRNNYISLQGSNS